MIGLPSPPPPSQYHQVMILFPDGVQVLVPYSDDTLLIDLLPKIARRRALRLYTNEYEFHVGPADQKLLMVSYINNNNNNNNVSVTLLLFWHCYRVFIYFLFALSFFILIFFSLSLCAFSTCGRSWI
jgi:hypothetical protein